MLAQSQDMEMKFFDLTKDVEIHEKSSRYYQSQLHDVREEYQKLLNMYSDMKETIDQFQNPDLANDDPRAIELKRLELKNEGLTLINKQMAQNVADSQRVIKVIENTCIKEIEKVEEVLKAHIRMLAHQQLSEGDSPQHSKRKFLYFTEGFD